MLTRNFSSNHKGEFVTVRDVKEEPKEISGKICNAPRVSEKHSTLYCTLVRYP